MIKINYYNKILFRIKIENIIYNLKINKSSMIVTICRGTFNHRFNHRKVVICFKFRSKNLFQIQILTKINLV